MLYKIILKTEVIVLIHLADPKYMPTKQKSRIPYRHT
jgi:hypothetical protein